MRGRRVIENQNPRTRPANLETKKGIGEGAQDQLLVANYFHIKTIPNWALQQYRVDIAPEEDRTSERKRLLKVHEQKLGGYLFDGTVLYTSNRLTGGLGESISLTSQSETGTIYIITVKHVSEVDFGDYAYTQVFNLLMRHCLSALGLQLVGRDYYDPNPRAKVLLQQFRMELWPGYKTSIRQHESSILMCVEITHKVMRMDTVYTLLMECYNRNKNDYQRDFMRQVVGCIVLTKYNNKTYRIDDVDFNTNPSHTFPYQNADITYAQYMRDKYQIAIRDLRQPMLISMAKARDIRAGLAEIIYLIPEVCYCTGLTDEMKKNFRLMRALADHTRVAPDSRISKLKRFNEILLSNERAMEKLRKFEMTLDQNLVRIQGRKLQAENIYLSLDNSIKSEVNESADWTPFIQKGTVLAKDLLNWVFLMPMEDKSNCLQFVENLQRAGSGMGLKIASPEIRELQRTGVGDYVQALGQILDRGQPQLIMCAVANSREDKYAAIKKKCCVDRAVPSQVVQVKNFQFHDQKVARRILSIATKVAIQLNCKIGGAPWRCDMPLKKLMVVGFDVCHDTISKSQTFGAMVASLDGTFSRYFSAVTPHSTGNELSTNLALNIIKALKKYQSVNQGNLPEKIIIYRDGVGEGQLPFVYSSELGSIKEKLNACYAGKPFDMAFIVVTKRLNTRIFTERKGNPGPGSVVDDVITDPEKYDFFLISQSVRDGTVSPTSYNILYSTFKLSPLQLQRITYKFTHLYFNWSGTVRVPAPCQYAHKLAFLVGQALHREPNSLLEDLLYFL